MLFSIKERMNKFNSKFFIPIIVLGIFFSINKSIGELLFNPLRANIYESRLGAVFTDNQKKIRLDIGGNYDLYQNLTNPKFKWAIGSEFFTYTRLRSEGNFKFPVETTDFYFGVNTSNNITINEQNIQSRLRIAHISTHLSDGLLNNGFFEQQPIVYSREFLELHIATQLNFIRPYIGLTYVFSYLPRDVSVVIPQFGAEFDFNLLHNIEFTAAYDFKLNGYRDTPNSAINYNAMNMIILGVVVRTESNRGILLKLEKYFGNNYYGQFYKDCDNYLGFGFELLYH